MEEEFARLVVSLGLLMLLVSLLQGAAKVRGIDNHFAASYNSDPTSSSSSSCDIPAIYNFGDSNSDTGGIAAAFYPMSSPCGETFFKRPAGRPSDGRLIIDFIAEHLGLPYLSAYLNSIKANFSKGANFATGGATITRVNESWFAHNVSPFSLDIQVEQYDQFKERTTYFYNQGNDAAYRSDLPQPGDFAKALYTFDIGQNDIGAGFRTLGVQGTRALIPDIVAQFSTLIQQLYGKGARAFWVHNTGPIGCLPVTNVKIRDPVPGYLDEIGCVAESNDICKEFNKQLKDRIDQFRIDLSEATITYVDLYAAKYQLISTAKDQGFEDRFTICCGHHDFNDDVWCGNKGTINGSEVFGGSCEDPSKVISWDGVHYTEAANKWIASRIVNGSFTDPPILITQTCPKSPDI